MHRWNVRSSLLLRLTTSMLLLLMSGAAWIVTTKVSRLIDTANTVLSQTQQDLSKLSSDLHGTSQNLNAVLIQAGLTADEARRAAMEQRRYWAKNSAETHEVLVKLKETVADVDQIARDVDVQVESNGQTLQSSLDQIGRVANDTDQLVSKLDSSLTLAQPQFQTTLDNLALTSQHISAASDSVQLASKDIQVKVHQLTRPAKWWMSVGEKVLSLGAQVGEWSIGFFK